MGFPSLESSLNQVSNRYLLVVLAAKRARQINRGAASRVETRYRKPTSTALEEIAAARVDYRVKDEGEPAKT
jgi:DNA-directed RNA polymerase subunit omega